MFGLGINKVYKFGRGLIADFRAKLLSTSIVRGIGELSPPSIGDSDGDRLVADHENIWRSCKAEEVRIAGARRVENLLPFSEDMTQSNLVATNGATVDNASQVTFDGTANGTIQDQGAANTTTGRSYIFSCSIRLISGSISADNAVQVGIVGTGLANVDANIGNEISASETRFSIPVTTNATGAIRPQVVCDDAVTLEISKWMLEESTGRSDTTTPSEYVSTGVAPGNAYRIRNLVKWSEDFSQAEWEKLNTATVSGSNTINLPAVNDAVIEVILGNVASKSFVGSVVLSGTGTCTLQLTNRIDDSEISQITLTDTPTRYSVSHTFNSTTATNAGFRIFRNTGDTATEVTATQAMLEDTTNYPASATVPSEYVSTGVGTGEELIDDPSFDVDFASSDWVDSSTGTGTAVISGGQLTTTRVDGSNLGSARQEFATEIGATYVFETEVASGTAWRVFIGTTAGASDVSNTTLTNKVVFTATSATTWVQLSNFTNGSSAVWDSFSVKRINHGANVDGVYWSDPTDVGPELWTDLPTTVNSVWTANGDGSYTASGASFQNVEIERSDLRDGGTYLIEFDVNAYTAGQVGVWVIGDVLRTDIALITATGSYKYVATADSSTGLGKNRIVIRGESSFSGTISNISVKRINPGWNVNGVKYYITENGNSVTNNVVTEGFGANLTTIKGLYMEGAHTELSGRSADIGNWSAIATATVAQDAVGLSGEPNTAFTVTDNSAVARQDRALNTSISSSSDDYYAYYRIKYDASPSVYPLIRIALTGGTGVAEVVVFDPSDGSFVEQTAQGDVVSVTRIGDFWHVLLKATDNGTGNTTAQLNLSPAYNTDGSSVSDVTAQGSTVFASCELYKDSPSYAPILTTGGTTKTVNADTEYTLDVANWPNPDGEFSFKFNLVAFFNKSTGSTQGIISDPTAIIPGFVFSGVSDGRLVLGDGLNSVIEDNAYSLGREVLVKAVASTSRNQIRFSVDGDVSNTASYDGSFNFSDSIMLGKDLTRAIAIKELNIYSVDLGNDWLT